VPSMYHTMDFLAQDRVGSPPEKLLRWMRVVPIIAITAVRFLRIFTVFVVMISVKKASLVRNAGKTTLKRSVGEQKWFGKEQFFCG
jgi:hypothetical protein